MATPAHYNILLVEDNAPNVMVATAMLDTLGYSYRVAGNGVEGVKQFTLATYDLILMDVQMPAISGIETAELIRSIEKKLGHSTPIVAMTAHMNKADLNKCMAAGIDDIIPKPFHPDYFAKILSKYCKRVA